MPRTRTPIAGCIAIAVSALTLASPGLAGAAEPRIIKGQDADITDYPYQVSLQVDSREEGYVSSCGGSIIDETHIVTAAHCVRDDSTDENGDPTGGTDGPVNPRYVTVGYGSAELDDQYEVAVAEVDMPAAYPANFSFDVARLTLAKPLEDYGTDSVDRIPLITTSDLAPAIAAEENVFVSGWGNTTNKGQGSDTLQYVALPLRADSVCDGGPDDAYVPEFALCIGGKGTAQSNNPDSCQGDSGGPAALQVADNPQDPTELNDYLVGIVAFGDECGKKLTPGAYTDVTNTDVRAVIEGTFGGVLKGSQSPLYPRDVPVVAAQQPQAPPPVVTTGARPVQPVEVRDTVKPTVRLTKSACKKGGRCTFRLAVADNSGDINETQFAITRKVKKCKRVKGKRRCKKVTQRAALREKNVKGGIEVSAKLKKGTWTLTAVVLDDADNKSKTVTKTFRVKG